MWPSLYWCTEMRETTERATDPRRVAAAAVSVRNAALSDDENEEQAEEESGRHSVKRSFMRKVFSPIIGYGQDFQLLQFAYDLTMGSRIGGGKNACAGLPLRLVLKGETFSPLYWKSKHQALMDMQHHCNYPSLFKTMAPWEYSFPYHIFVLDEMEKGGVQSRPLLRSQQDHSEGRLEGPPPGFHLAGGAPLPNGGQPLSAPGVSGREAEASDPRLSRQRTRARP